MYEYEGLQDMIFIALYCETGLVAQIHLHFEDGVYTGHHVTLWPVRSRNARLKVR